MVNGKFARRNQLTEDCGGGWIVDEMIECSLSSSSLVETWEYPSSLGSGRWPSSLSGSMHNHCRLDLSHRTFIYDVKGTRWQAVKAMKRLSTKSSTRDEEESLEPNSENRSRTQRQRFASQESRHRTEEKTGRRFEPKHVYHINTPSAVHLKSVPAVSICCGR